ncbi:MAG: enoyl-CoA hydratase-related protein [Dehalococcoidia bacterium]|nr:enoyl-CoA hydratase-related protein [Dehalococcoidia bacterium]
MSYSCIIYETRDRVAIITLNRPEKLNAWTSTMAAEIGDALRRSNENDDIGAIVVTGAGRAFCAGADVIEEFKRRADAQDAGDVREQSERSAAGSFVNLQDELRYGKPSIAAINGYGVGVGLTFPLNCDFRIAAENARLNTMFLRVGLVPEFGSSYLLPRIVGLAKACELVYIPRWIEADEALAIGLVNKVVPADRLMPEAMEMAKTIAAGPAFALKKAKELLYRNLDSDQSKAAMLEVQYFAECMATAEHREGIRAFVEKREPDFQRPEVRGQRKE